MKRPHLIIALLLLSTVHVALAACGVSAFGRVFINPVRNSAGRSVGVVVDFVKTARFSSMRIAVELRYRGVSLVIPGGVEKPVTDAQGQADGYLACVAMPDTRRLTLLSRTGELSTDARIRVVARERIATGNTVGCTGAVIDDAVWPAGTATISGGAADGGVTPDSVGGDL
jgi:hypothetical protein